MTRNQKIKYGSSVVLLSASGAASAALPAAVTAAFTSATSDGTELGYLFMALAVVVGVIFWLKRKAG